MSIIADLHLHSKYSRAVSQKMDLFEIGKWAKNKGIQLLTTGDWTHPLWFRHIKENLKEVNQGIYQLPSFSDINFILTTEISSIYSHENKVRRIHNLIFSPSIDTCEKVIKKLQNEGANLLADGRPIIGISAKDLLEMVLEIDENILLVPCHVWTPWFSLYGSKSGFNSIEECFGNYSKYIYAIETGLSSDPIMNWQIKELENLSILSFSDAHSGPKLGREATVFVPKTDIKYQISNIKYDDIAKAVKQDSSGPIKIGYTIEFFPEEGKYHWSGHRLCNVRYNAGEIEKKGKVCPVCQKPLTIGVENRVFDLSSTTIKKSDLLLLKNKSDLTFVYDKEKKRKPFVSLVPLLEILMELNEGSPTKAQQEYDRLTGSFATEFDILLKKSYEEIEQIGGPELRKAITVVRNRKVFIDPGYDGVFGIVKIFHNQSDEKNKKQPESQQTLF